MSLIDGSFFLVLAGAGVFLVVTVGTLAEVKVELGADFFTIGGFEGDDGWDVVAFGKSGV